MKILHIATLGIHANERVQYVLTATSAPKVLLIATSENEDDAKSLKQEYERVGIEIEYRVVRPWEYDEILATVLDYVVDYLDHELTFNISCGTIAMRAACHMAAALVGATVYYVTEDEHTKIGRLVRVNPLPMSSLSAAKQRILEELAKHEDGVESFRELGSRVDLEVASISKHIKGLREVGYVKTERKGRRHRTWITELGRIVLRLKQARKGIIWGRNDDEDRYRDR